MTDEPHNSKSILNDIDQGVVGTILPCVVHVQEEQTSFPAHELEIEEGDHLRIDEQPMDKED